jgi:S1-C subfamily serine protease
MLSSVGFYRQADFGSEADWPIGRSITDAIWREADSVTTFTESVVGTGTILQFSANRIALLTSAHVVTFDDTVKTYFRVDGEPTALKSVAVKIRQRNYVAEIEGADRLDVLARDDRLDIAIVGQALNTRDAIVRPIPVSAGHADRLTWGSFVYVVGFPVGLRMVSFGVISQPERDRDGSFLTDVPFNRGMSGSPVFATRSDGTSLEWVGLVVSGSAHTEYMLAPAENALQEGVTSRAPYEGDMFVERTQRVRYGVAMGVSVEAVRRLIDANQVSLIRKGYRLNLLD